MNDIICDALNLSRMDELFPNSEDDSVDESENDLDEIVDEDGTMVHDSEASDIIEEAMRAHRDLMDLAMSMEPKNAGSVATSASSFLKIALDASRSKTDTKLNKMKLELEKKKLLSKAETNKANVLDISNNVVVANRNDVLKQLQK